MSAEFVSAPLTSIAPETLYRILQLRTDVFVVEQNCAYPELDGRDLEPDCLQVWANDGDHVAATLRILQEENGLRIGRVVANPEYRGTGVARQLFSYGLQECERIAPKAQIVLDAQVPVRGWYESFGFTAVGEEFLEDDIPHIHMIR